MAGSIADFVYEAGNGENYWMRMDKSNAALVGNTAIGGTTRPGVPRSITMRYAVYQSVDGKVTRRINVGSRSATTAQLPQSITDVVINANGSGACFLRRFVAEQNTLPNSADTAVTQN